MSAAAVLLLHLGLSLQTPTITAPSTAEPVHWGVRTTWQYKSTTSTSQKHTSASFYFPLNVISLGLERLGQEQGRGG